MLFGAQWAERETHVRRPLSSSRCHGFESQPTDLSRKPSPSLIIHFLSAVKYKPIKPKTPIKKFTFFWQELLELSIRCLALFYASLSVRNKILGSSEIICLSARPNNLKLCGVSFCYTGSLTWFPLFYHIVWVLLTVLRLIFFVFYSSNQNVLLTFDLTDFLQTYSAVTHLCG